MHDLAECADDLPTIADFKPGLRAALDDRFALSKADAASHPFVTATVLDLATKLCELFSESLRFAAYGNVCELMSEAAASLQAKTDGGGADESASPPAKRAKTDSRSVSNRLSRDDDWLRKKTCFISLLVSRATIVS